MFTTSDSAVLASQNERSRLLRKLIPAVAGLLLVSICVNMVQLNMPTTHQYFGRIGNGQPFIIKGTLTPPLTDEYVIAWAADKVTRAYSLDPLHFEQQVASLQPAFTADGYVTYKKAIEAQLHDYIDQNLVLVSAIPSGEPVLSGVTPPEVGFYAWQIQVPVLVSFHNKTTNKKRLRVQVTVVKQATSINVEGLGISQFIAQEF